MPFILPTIPFTTGSTFVTGVIFRQSTAAFGRTARLDASIASFIPVGGASTFTSLGADLGTAPAEAQILIVTADTVTFETGMASAFIGTAQASATLSIFVQEFAATGTFIRTVTGPPTVVFDAAAYGIGVNLRINETNNRAAFFTMPVVRGRFYRAFLSSLQFVSSAGGPVAEAVSNFTYDFGPLFFTFV